MLSFAHLPSSKPTTPLHPPRAGAGAAPRCEGAVRNKATFSGTLLLAASWKRRRVSANAAKKAAPVIAEARRAQRRQEYDRMKRQSLIDATAVGLLGALLSYFNTGADAAEGFLVGGVFGALYLLLLQLDVNSLTVESNPFNLFNPWRILRFLLPFGMVLALGLLNAVALGFDKWLEQVSWEPGVNFVNVTPPSALYAAVVSYTAVAAVLPLRGLLETLPEARTLVKAVPGSLGVALDLADKAGGKKPARPTSRENVKVIPVLLITGPRGCGKSTLAQNLMKKDARFQEPEWVATAPISSMGASRLRLVSKNAFETLESSRSLAVSFLPAGDDLEEGVPFGLPAMSVLSTAENGACVLDVNAPTARYILSYNWEPALAAFDERVELRLVTVWVSMASLDDIVERNRLRLESRGLQTPSIEQQLKPLRAQVTADMEWALTSGSLDFTILNTDEEAAMQELVKASRYCFEDPF